MLIKRKLPRGFFVKIILPTIALLLFLNMLINLFITSKDDNSATLKKEEAKKIEQNITPNQIKNSKNIIKVSGLGVSEPKSESIKIGAFNSGIVANVYVEVGQKIAKNAKLFKIDDEKAKAELELKIANLKILEVDLKEKNRQLKMFEDINDKRAFSQDDYEKAKNNSITAKYNLQKAQAELNQAKINLEQMLVKSPIAGEVLQVNIRAGEYALANSINPLVLIGDLSEIYLRVEIDEADAHLISSSAKAYAYPRGDIDFKIPLKFVRIEPFVVPKISISGTNNEKVDSRVLQVIYSLENNSSRKILVGQNFDVFIEVASQ